MRRLFARIHGWWLSRDDVGQAVAPRAAERVGGHVDLGGQSASGAPQSLVAGPPFPVAAC